MPIEGVNTAMTPLQFTRARSLTRTVETSEGASAGRSGPRYESMPEEGNAASQARAATRMVAPATFHWSYRPIVGKQAAKRIPQLADSQYWSRSLNRLG